MLFRSGGDANLAARPFLLSFIPDIYFHAGPESATYIYVDLAGVDPALLPAGGELTVEVRKRLGRGRHRVSTLSLCLPGAACHSPNPHTPPSRAPFFSSRASTRRPPPSASLGAASWQAPGANRLAACCSCTRRRRRRRVEKEGGKKGKRVL